MWIFQVSLGVLEWFYLHTQPAHWSLCLPRQLFEACLISPGSPCRRGLAASLPVAYRGQTAVHGPPPALLLKSVHQVQKSKCVIFFYMHSICSMFAIFLYACMSNHLVLGTCAACRLYHRLCYSIINLCILFNVSQSRPRNRPAETRPKTDKIRQIRLSVCLSVCLSIMSWVEQCFRDYSR